ncbi:tetratricopeptide repeat protein [Chryseotalea sanaruensis]|uniref:Tetratricopeptide repeat protein n=2 Tax=Chryseotalea sanaruensis TaxID=2482724 RepID=A0A401UD92_9BACT|nr:tetratricopeptide repeat protein [Chryseotalea sanaruensis]
MSCSTSGQETNKISESSLTDDEITKRYLEKGAWTLRYFSPEYQSYLDSAIHENPNIAYYYQQKAMPYFKLGKYEVGLKILEKAVELDPKSYIDYKAFIQCIFQKNYQNALESFITAKKIKGVNGYVMDHSYDFYIGLCYLQLNEFEKAVKYFEASISEMLKSNSESWVHHLDLLYAGIAFQELNNHEMAIKYFDRALKKYPNFSDVKYYKSISLFRLGLLEVADELLNSCELDFKRGFTINEDNAIYEKYPYQIKQFYIDMLRLTKR